VKGNLVKLAEGGGHKRMKRRKRKLSHTEARRHGGKRGEERKINRRAPRTQREERGRRREGWLAFSEALTTIHPVHPVLGLEGGGSADALLRCYG